MTTETQPNKETPLTEAQPWVKRGVITRKIDCFAMAIFCLIGTISAYFYGDVTNILAGVSATIGWTYAEYLDRRQVL